MNKLATLLRNTGYLLVAELARPALSFFFFAYLSRSQGVEAVGAYGLILAYTFSFETIATLGLGPIITRAVAVEHSTARFYLRTSLLFAAASTAVLLPVLLGVAHLLHYSGESAAGIRWLGCTLLLAVLLQYFQAIFEGFQKMQYRSALSLLETVGRVSLGLLALVKGYGILGVIQAMIAVRIVVTLLAFVLVRHAAGKVAETAPPRESYGELFRQGLPILAVTVVATLYWQIDILMLSKLGTLEQVGIYNAAYRLMDILKGLTYTYLVALFPAISASFATSRASFQNECEMSIKYLLIVSLPAAAGVSILAGPIIHTIYGAEFGDSINVLRLLIWTVCIFPAALVFAKALVASHNQKLDLYVNLASLVVNVGLNAVLIRYFGANGAAAATLISIIFFLMLESYAVSRILFKLPLLEKFAKPLLATAMMSVVTWMLRDSGLPLAVGVSVVVYLAALVALKSFSESEVLALRGALRQFRPRPAE